MERQHTGPRIPPKPKTGGNFERDSFLFIFSSSFFFSYYSLVTLLPAVSCNSSPRHQLVTRHPRAAECLETRPRTTSIGSSISSLPISAHSTAALQLKPVLVPHPWHYNNPNRPQPTGHFPSFELSTADLANERLLLLNARPHSAGALFAFPSQPWA